MSDSLSQVARIQPQRRAGRRTTDPAIARAEAEEEAEARTNLPVPVAAPLRQDKPSGAAFEAHLMGQDGQRRGLRGGPPVLNSARSAYLGAEYAGPADRRPPRGAIKKTEV
jgi:hypothetical protein